MDPKYLAGLLAEGHSRYLAQPHPAPGRERIAHWLSECFIQHKWTTCILRDVQVNSLLAFAGQWTWFAGFECRGSVVKAQDELDARFAEDRAVVEAALRMHDECSVLDSRLDDVVGLESGFVVGHYDGRRYVGLVVMVASEETRGVSPRQIIPETTPTERGFRQSSAFDRCVDNWEPVADALGIDFP